MKKVKSWIKKKVRDIVHQMDQPLSTLKYLSYKNGEYSYFLPKPNLYDASKQIVNPLPPEPIWRELSNSPEEYLSIGLEHTHNMLRIMQESAVKINKGSRILDFGCGAGRMMRHLNNLVDDCEIWGTDINSTQIIWAKQHLGSPLRFVTTTTIPHLPFEDAYFDFIYCGSLFTHIEELADTWLCEVRRILKPGGFLYITIHDEGSLNILENKYPDFWLTKMIKADKYYKDAISNLGMYVVCRDANSQVFYDLKYFDQNLELLGFRVISATKEAYAYQTAVLAERK